MSEDVIYPRNSSEYNAIHHRTRISRGDAPNYPCIECGGSRNVEWSWSWKTKPDQLSPDSYDPRCHSCHFKYDFGERPRYSITEETRRRMSDSKLGKRPSPETRAKMSAAKKGRPGPTFSAATRAKMSASAKSRAHPRLSPDTRAKIYASAAGRKRDPRGKFMAGKFSTIQFDWPVGSKDPWDDLYKHIKREIERGTLIPVHPYACMVTVTFTMKLSERFDRYHTDAPSLATLADKLLDTLANAGVIDELAVTQLNIGKVLPGPNASKTSPGVRISIMVMGELCRRRTATAAERNATTRYAG